MSDLRRQGPKPSDSSRIQTDRVEAEKREGDFACADLQAQMLHAREMMDQSRRLLRAALTEPRSFRRED